MSHLSTLARRSLGPGALATGSVVSSSPLTVLVGGITVIYATTGVKGVPLAYLIVMVVIGLLAVGYIAVSRHVPHGAPFYGQLAHGANKPLALAAAGVAFVGYNCLQISLYPLIGTAIAGLFGAGSWWGWAFVAGCIVALLGRYPGAFNAKVLGVLLLLEISVIVMFIWSGFTHPADGTISVSVFVPSNLLVVGLAPSVLVFAVASMSGWESLAAFAEEARSHRALVTAAAVAVTGCGTLYLLASWSYGTWLGLGNLQPGAADPKKQPLALLGQVWGPGITDLATFLLISSVLGAMVNLHAAAARYVFALARENILPASWGKVTRGSKGGAPLGGSRVQTVTAAVVLLVFMLGQADPMGTIFTWLSAIGAFCILLLLTAASWSAANFFSSGRGRDESVWVRTIFPVAGGVGGVLLTLIMASSMGTLLNTAPGSAMPWLVAVPIAGAVTLGLLTAGWLRVARPQVYAGIGRGVPDPSLVLDDELSDLQV